MNIVNKIIIGAALLFIFQMTALAATDRIVAVVNDEIITQNELNRAFEPYAKRIEDNYQGGDTDTVIKQNKGFFLQRMIDQILIEQEAKKMGMASDSIKDEEVMAVINDMLTKNNISKKDYVQKLAAEGSSLEIAKKEIRGQMLRMKLLRREVQSRILVTDEEIGEYYNKHRQDYEGKEAAHIHQILLPASKGAGILIRQNTKEQAQKLRERILQGESFEELAAQYSKDPSAASGGDIGFVEKGVILPQVDQAAFSLPVGEVSEIIETDLGYHLIIVVDRRGAGFKLPLEARHEIKAKIEDEKVSKKYDEWIESLRKKSFIDNRL